MSLALVLAASFLYAQDDAGRLYSEALQAQAAGDLNAAVGKYQAIIRLHPRMAEAFANLGNLYYQMGQTARAKAAYEKSIALKPNLAGPYFFLGVIAFRDRDYTTAVRHLERARALQPSNALIDSYLGYAWYARGEYSRSAEALEQAFDRDNRDVDVLYHLSKCYGHLAGNAFEQMRNAFPNSAYTSLARAHAAEINEDYRDSPPSGAKLTQEMARFRSKLLALKAGGKTSENLYAIGEAYQALSYLCMLAVFEADPDCARAHQLRAQTLEQAKNDDGAIEEYRKALERNPDLQNIHFAIGSLLWKNQRFDQARTELLEELRMNPRHPEALYELGDIAAFGGNVSDAEKYFLEAIRLEPSMIEAHLALEKIYTQAGDYEKSLQHLAKASEIDPSDPTPNYRKSMIYRKLGKTNEAEAELAIFRQKQSSKPATSQ